MKTQQRGARWAILTVALIQAMCGWLAPAALAQERVTVEVMAIRASNQGTEISPELRDLADQLKKQFKFTSYKLEKRSSQALAGDAPVTFDLVGTYRVNVTSRGKSEDKHKLQVEFLRKGRDGKDGRLLSTAIMLPPGRAQLFGGWKLDGDAVLISAVTPR